MKQKPSKKPPWLHTKISEPHRIKLYTLMLKNNGYKPFKTAFDFSEEFTEDEKKQIPTSSATYGRLWRDIDEVPLIEVQSFPLELRDRIMERRPELRAEMESLEKSPQEALGQESEKVDVTTGNQSQRTHPEEMVDIAEALLGNDLAFTTRRHIAEIDADLYSIRYKGNYTDEELSGKVGTNIAQAMDLFPPESIDSFAAHVKAEYPQLQGDKLSEIARHNPFELIRACSLINKRGTVKGKCQICEGQ